MTCATNYNHGIAATLYTLEACFFKCIIVLCVTLTKNTTKTTTNINNANAHNNNNNNNNVHRVLVGKPEGKRP
jgi:hypothetical protein